MSRSRLSFNENVVNYDKWRPTYSSEMFQDLLKFSQIDEGSKVMEVGIGTGQATRPFLDVGCDVTAVEIGEDLADYTRAKYREYSNLSVEQVAFEDAFYLAESIDLLYSATAFHWIPKDIGYPKAASLLKPNGTLALFWNRPFVNRANDDVHQAIGRIYQTYRPTTEQLVEHDTEKYETRVQTIEAYGFKDVTCKLYHRTRAFCANDYISLLNTYSDHRRMPSDTRLLLENDVRKAILEAGDRLNVYDTIDLYLARK